MGHPFAGGDHCWRFEASGHLCCKSMGVTRGEVDRVGAGEEGRRSRGVGCYRKEMKAV